MKKIIYTTLLVASVALLVVKTTSCKGSQPCNATITVMDSSGTHPQANVNVHLWAQITYNGNSNYQGDLVVNGVTNTSGQVSFTIKNPCILNITATVPSCTTNIAARKYCEATGIIRFDEGQTNTQTVNLNQ
ncbi:MAG: hypothetical protein JST67_03760 [Bacteroidetes bacterium]|nr:hypothetical protein [Bacteroidota bacterium]